MTAPIITFFNNKGGVGKTSTLYNLSRMFAKLGKRVLAVDLDPQANLTSLCLDDETLLKLWENEDYENQDAQTIYHAVQQLIEGIGDVKTISPKELLPNALNYAILPGDLRLSQFEDKLASEWNSVLGGKPSGLNVTSAFARLIKVVAESYQADIIFVDVGPNLGAINRAALIASDYVAIPLIPDLFSIQGLKNVGKYLVDWRKDWQQGLNNLKVAAEKYPTGKMQPIGYIILQHRERQSRLVAAHQRWAAKVPQTYIESVLGQSYEDTENDPNMIGSIRNYQSMMALSHESRKPIFDLKPADGAIGSHVRVVKESEDTYRNLAIVIAERVGLSLDLD